MTAQPNNLETVIEGLMMAITISLANEQSRNITLAVATPVPWFQIQTLTTDPNSNPNQYPESYPNPVPSPIPNPNPTEKWKLYYTVSEKVGGHKVGGHWVSFLRKILINFMPTNFTISIPISGDHMMPIIELVVSE